MACPIDDFEKVCRILCRAVHEMLFFPRILGVFQFPPPPMIQIPFSRDALRQAREGGFERRIRESPKLTSRTRYVVRHRG